MTTLGDSQPTYRHVADELRTEITTGHIQPGERLPSVRDLAARFEIAEGTTQSALRVLRDEGFVVSRSTRGYFVRDQLPEPPQPSAEYTMLRNQLGAVQATVETLTERVNHLEEALGRPERRPRRQPSREPEPDEPGPPSAP